jgi:hypothetical protein
MKLHKKWPPCPFTKGQSYIVTRSFDSTPDHFTKGDVLVFREVVHSRYDGALSYLFDLPEHVGKEWTNITQGKRWTVAEDGDLTSTSSMFQEIENKGTPNQAL